MTDDLVARLRAGGETCGTDTCKVKAAKSGCLCAIAANRIEQLEAALRKAEQGLSVALMWSDDDGTWVAHEIVVKARDAARAALEGKDGG